MFEDYPSVHLKRENRRLIENGTPFFPEHTLEGKIWGEGVRIRVYDEGRRFYGIYVYDKNWCRYQPVNMLLA